MSIVWREPLHLNPTVLGNIYARLGLYSAVGALWITAVFYQSYRRILPPFVSRKLGNGYWNHGNRQANLNRNDPRNQNPNNGFRSVARFKYFVKISSIHQAFVQFLGVWLEFGIF